MPIDKKKQGSFIKRMQQATFSNRKRKGAMPSDPKVAQAALSSWLATNQPTKCPPAGSTGVAAYNAPLYPKGDRYTSRADVRARVADRAAREGQS